MSIDPFEQEFVRWLRGIQQDAKARQEDANLTTLVNTLQQQGHTITWDYMGRYIFVDADGPQPLTITMENAREMPPEQLLQWVKERMR